MSRSVNNEGPPLGHWLASLPPSTRALICLAIASSVAVYGTLAILAIPGVSTHLLGQHKYNLWSIGLVMLFGWIGYRTHRPWVAGGVLTVLLLSMWAFGALLFAPPALLLKAIWYGWYLILMAFAWPILQILIFERLMRYTGDEREPRPA